MTNTQRAWLFILRIALGWLFFWAGITKVLNPEWTAAGYLSGAKTFAGFFNWLASPAMIPIIDFINQWGLTLLGLSLIFGLCVRWSSILGAILMLLYYLPILDFPYPNTHSFIVDEHIIYALVLIFFWAIKAGKYWGLDGRKKQSPLNNYSIKVRALPFLLPRPVRPMRCT